MNEEEFKITIRAFYPTAGFDSYDCGDAHVVVSDCLCHDTLGPGFGFKYVRFDDGHVSVCYGEVPIDIHNYPNVLAETVKNMQHAGWYLMFYRFMRGG